MKKFISLSRCALLVLIVVAVSACTTTQGPRTAPERSVRIEAPQKVVKDILALGMVDNGFNLSKDTEYSMEFWRETQDAAAAFLLSSRYNYTVHTRISVTIIGDNPTTVSARAFYVTNPLSAHERLTDITNSPKSDELGVFLKQLKQKAEEQE